MDEDLIEDLRKNHISQVVDLHIEAFADSFLTQLSRDFLTILYEEFSRSGFGYVFLENGNVAGFLAGIFSSADIFYRDIIKNNIFRLSILLLRSVIRNPILIKSILNRGTRLIFKKKPFYIESLPEYDQLIHSRDVVASALTMSVSQKYRGRGIASQLWTHLLHDLPKKGVEAIIASVQSDNTITNKFYKKRGFILIARIQRHYGNEELKWLFFQRDKCIVTENGYVTWY